MVKKTCTSTFWPFLNNKHFTLKECKQLIKILLKELQIVYQQKKAENMPETIEREETANDEADVVEDNYVSDIQGNQKAYN